MTNNKRNPITIMSLLVTALIVAILPIQLVHAVSTSQRADRTPAQAVNPDSYYRHPAQSTACDTLPHIVSRANTALGALGNQDSAQEAVSAEGRYVAFRSEASNLVANDTNNEADIFVRDRETCTTTRVSVASDGTQANNSSAHPSISGDGRYVVFQSTATNLVANDTNLFEDVYLYDRQTGQTTLISHTGAAPMVSGNSTSWQPVISADGRWIAFSTKATNLASMVAGSAQNFEVVLYDRTTDHVTNITQYTGSPNQLESGSPAISGDGRYVVFASVSLDSTNDVTGHTDIYLYDRVGNATTIVSKGLYGGPANGLSTDPAISSDGRFIAYASTADNIAGGDSTGCAPFPSCSDIFLYDRIANTTIILSFTLVTPFTDMGHWRNPSISADGRFVVFDGGYAQNLYSCSYYSVDPYPTNLPYLTPTQTSTQTVTATQTTTSTATNTPTRTPTPTIAMPPTICVDCAAPARSQPTDCVDVFIYDRTSNEVRLVSRNNNVFGDERSLDPVISGDGRVVSFNTLAENLTTDDTNGRRDIVALYNAEADSILAPPVLSATATSAAQIQLTWTDNAYNESEYRIERSPDGVNNWAEIGTAPANATSYTNNSLSCGATYSYRVRAYRASDGVYSVYSNTASATTSMCNLIAPSYLGATVLSASQIRLNWMDGATNETNYRVERSPDGVNNWAEIGTLPANTVSYINSSLICGTAYYYRVRAYRASDTSYSAYSNVVTQTTTACPADAIAIFNATTQVGNLVKSLTNPPVASDYVYYTTGFPYGAGGQYVMGDWNGDGLDTMGVYLNGAFWYTNTYGQTGNWTGIWIGVMNRPPVAGRFAANIHNDCIGVVDSGEFPPYGTAFALYFTCNLTSGATPPLTFQWLSVVLPTNQGHSGTHQFGAGDFDGDGLDSIAIRRGNYIAWTNIPPTTLLSQFSLAQYIGALGTGDEGQLVVGDWNLNNIDSFGLVYQNGRFYRRDDLTWNSGAYSLQQFTPLVGTPFSVTSWRPN